LPIKRLLEVLTLLAANPLLSHAAIMWAGGFRGGRAGGVEGLVENEGRGRDGGKGGGERPPEPELL
jgi:hypothetical protein